MDINRRRFLGASAMIGATVTTGLLSASDAQAEEVEPMVTAGIITDMHHTTKADTATRKYSAAKVKMQAFVDAMRKEQPHFLVEMGDFVDTLAPGTDPAENLTEVEAIFASYGDHYHVLGNHEFDNLSREFVLKSLTNTGIAQGQTYYSWDAGGIHFVVLDADYTPEPPHRPYDMNTPEDSFWTWKDTFVPPQELAWLRDDLQKTRLPTVVFTHQTLDRVDEQDHNIKNGSTVRAILEDSGKVLAVFSGHDHAGGYSNIKGIHYLVMNGNVGVSDSRSWNATSHSNGFAKDADNQYALLKVFAEGDRRYRLVVEGHGRQPSYQLTRRLS